MEVLIPDVLRSIPSSLTQAIRNFAKSLESWLYSAMLGCPQELVTIKVIKRRRRKGKKKEEDRRRTRRSNNKNRRRRGRESVKKEKEEEK